MLFWLGVFVSSALCERSAHVQISDYRLRIRVVHQDFPFLSRRQRHEASPRFDTTYLCCRWLVSGCMGQRLKEIILPPDAKRRLPLVKMMADTVRSRALTALAATVPPVDQQNARSANAKEGICPKTGFVESRVGDSENAQKRTPRDPDEPRCVRLALTGADF